MRRATLGTLSILAVITLLTPSGASANGGGATNAVVPANSNAWGASLVTWQERWIAWAAGSSTNPIFSDICGEKVGGVYFLGQTAELGTKVVECHLKPGTRLLGTAGTSFTYRGSADETDDELLAELDAFFDPSAEHPRAILDGRSLGSSVATSLRYTDVYAIPLEPGNALAEVDPALVGADETRIASVGWYLRLKPLPPGRHVLVLSDTIDGVGKLEVKYRITVGRCGK